MKKYTFIAIAFWALMSIVSGCSDEPDKSNFYTFKGQMMSQYLQEHEQFSEFTAIVERAGFMDLLSTYGAYTCFPPTNEAVKVFLEKRGLSSVYELSLADCDTITRTHLVNNVYAMADMEDGVLSTANMNRRYIEVTHGEDEYGNPTVFLNGTAHIIFALRDDSVENGIMQPVSEVLESSNRMIIDVMKLNPNISLYTEAYIETGLVDSFYQYKDETWDPTAYTRYRYISHVNKETATVPDEKRIGFTFFVPTDSVLKEKYGIQSVYDLYLKACEIYDDVYPEDADADYHDFAQIKHPKNPLNRFLAYHVLTRDVKGWNYLTPVKDVGILTTVMNPVDWYETMLPHTMMKFERLTVRKWAGSSIIGERYINRRYDDEFNPSGDFAPVLGTRIERSVESEYRQDALNGRYFYVDDILKFDADTRDKVFNDRIRMDFSTIFPELMTNDIRLNERNNGMKNQDPDYDETAKFGRNYYFPNGYLKGVTLNEGCHFVYRRPHDWYDSYEGDEMNLFGDFDATFKIPPVPYEGDWQIRIGFAAEPTRGIAQIYFDDKPQGIPLDMTKQLNDASILGADWKADYNSMSVTDLATDQKVLKNKGYYRGAAGGYHYTSAGGTGTSIFATQPHTIRMVICTTHINPDEDHYLRIRCVSTKQGNDNEFMLDYLELVPKSVYGVTDEGKMENML
ncbi:MAG: fasciclin domain-containing protein [Bacteroidaceae bacterium]|nr:fasciclin domain-containing protein [Bacteroidaceae bacterium]MBR1789374.1 fasciclin domain-containing protein [Bacteroidaceae bacterium]